MEISYSELQTYQRCPKKYEYSLSIQRKAVAVPLALGIMVHRLLQEFYQAGWPGMEDEIETLRENFAENPYVIDDDLLTFEDLLTDAEFLVTAYFPHYNEDEGWEVLHIEEQFSIELGEHTLTFTPDLIVRDQSGQVWVVDHKTTAVLPDPGTPFGELQAMIYVSAVKKMYPETAGFLFNYLRKKRPRVPRITKTAPYRVADLARIDTTYEVLRDWIREFHPELETEPAHARRLAELRGNNKFFLREYVMTTPVLEAQVLNEARTWLAQMARDRNPLRVFGGKLYGIMACVKCPYQAICNADLLGWDREAVILQQYEPRDLSHKEYESA